MFEAAVMGFWLFIVFSAICFIVRPDLEGWANRDKKAAQDTKMSITKNVSGNASYISSHALSGQGRHCDGESTSQYVYGSIRVSSDVRKVEQCAGCGKTLTVKDARVYAELIDVLGIEVVLCLQCYKKSIR